MSGSDPGADYGSLFERVTGVTEVRELQDPEATAERTVEEDLSKYVTQRVRENGLDEALAEPDTE